MNHEDEEKNTTGQPPRLEDMPQEAGMLLPGHLWRVRHARGGSTAATGTHERTGSVTKPRSKLTHPLLYLAAGAMLSITVLRCHHSETHTHVHAGPGAVVHVVNGEPPAGKGGR